MNRRSFDHRSFHPAPGARDPAIRWLARTVAVLSGVAVLGYVLLASMAGNAAPKFVTPGPAPAPLSQVEIGRVVQEDAAVLRSGDSNLQVLPNATQGVVAVGARPLVAGGTRPVQPPQAAVIPATALKPAATMPTTNTDMVRAMQPQLSDAQMEEGKRQADAAAAILADTTPEG